MSSDRGSVPDTKMKVKCRIYLELKYSSNNGNKSESVIVLTTIANGRVRFRPVMSVTAVAAVYY